MSSKRIASYHESIEINNKKKEFFANHSDTKEEIEKTARLKERIEDYVKSLGQKEELKNQWNHIEFNIKYRSGVGYISSIMADRDIVDIYYYGSSEEKAYMNAIIDYESVMCQRYELKNRKKLNKDYSKRFLNGRVSDDDYHGPFFFAELALQDLRKYFGENIPQEFIDYYEKYLKRIEQKDYRYDYESNRLIELEESKKQFLKKP